MSLTIQFSTILVMIIGGFYLGCALETFRYFELYWKKKRILGYVMELCFWLLQTLLLFYLLFLVNQGELRLYILLAIFCGFAAYKSFFESIYRTGLQAVIQLLLRVHHFLANVFNGIVIRPIKAVLYILIVILLFCLKLLYRCVHLLARLAFFPIAIMGRGLMRLMPENAQKYLVSLAGFYSKIENNINKWWKSSWKKGR